MIPAIKVTIELTPTDHGSTSGGNPHLYTLKLPPNVKGLCRRGGPGTTDRDWVAYGQKTTMPVSASEDFAAYMAWKESQAK